ncbi:hypothetical protein DFJ73DRAFT_41850 [Zopfochytrium polystomum]|nr:hypothetical protein DFJ73DRAFT_41850 [Zopfochytrium polystomum]
MQFPPPSPSNEAPAQLAAQMPNSGSEKRADRRNRGLQVKDALAYLDRVKVEFGDQPLRYSNFLDIMKEFKSKRLDTAGVIERVYDIFDGYPSLLMGFSTFLPSGYKIETPTKAQKQTHETAAGPLESSAGESIQSSIFNDSSSAENTAPFPLHKSGLPELKPNLDDTHLKSALHKEKDDDSDLTTPKGLNEQNQLTVFLNKMKSWFSQQPGKHLQILEVLNSYKSELSENDEVMNKTQILLKDAPDLLIEFKQLFPAVTPAMLKETLFLGILRAGETAKESNNPDALTDNPSAKSSKRTFSAASPVEEGDPAEIKAASINKTLESGLSGGPNKRARVIQEAPCQYIPHPMIESDEMPGIPRFHSSFKSLPSFPLTSLTSNLNQGAVTDDLEEMAWLHRCKQAIGDRATYCEFLKLLNLFSQSIISTHTLVDRVKVFLSKVPEVFQWFKTFVKYDGMETDYREWTQSVSGSVSRVGHSYRRLPSALSRPICSGQDELCREVLNLEWVSQPAYVSETGFISHKKTLYEEALHRCEEERYEFDFNIDGNMHTIALLETINSKIQTMSQEEQRNFRLPIGLGGSSKSLYKRTIKKVYDNERGLEVIEQLHNNPAVAVPIVLKRLKNINEEWKRYQAEWNTVWREIEDKNFYRALDHQGTSFKLVDRKSISPKALLAEIDLLYQEKLNRSKFSSAVDSMSDFGLAFLFPDNLIFGDSFHIIMAHVSQIAADSKINWDRVGDFLSFHLSRIFGVDVADFDPTFKAQSHRSAGRGPIIQSADSTKGIEVSNLVEEQAASAHSANHGQVDANDEFSSGCAKIAPMFGNSNFYLFLRLYQIFYSRLLKLKDLAVNSSNRRKSSSSPHNSYSELHLVQEQSTYRRFLAQLLDLIECKIDQNEFEERCRSLYGSSAFLSFSMDKLIQAIVKHLIMIVSDKANFALAELLWTDWESKASGIAWQEEYRIKAEGNLLEDDRLFRFEYVGVSNK